MLQQLCNKNSIFLLKIKQAFAISFDHSKKVVFGEKYDIFSGHMIFLRNISNQYKNIVSINWFLNAFWPSSLHYHQLVCFLIQKLHASAADLGGPPSPCPRTFTVLLNSIKMNTRSSRIFVLKTVHTRNKDYSSRPVPSRDSIMEFDRHNLTLFELIWPFLKT